MCQLSAFLICLWIMTNVWLPLPDWIWLFIEFNLRLICVHLFASELAEEKKKRKSLRFGGSTSLVVIVVMWKSHLKWKCISFVIFHEIRTKLPVGKLFSFSRWFCKYPTVACTSCSRVRGRKGFQLGGNTIWTFNSNYYLDLAEGSDF